MQRARNNKAHPYALPPAPTPTPPPYPQTPNRPFYVNFFGCDVYNAEVYTNADTLEFFDTRFGRCTLCTRVLHSRFALWWR